MQEVTESSTATVVFTFSRPNSSGKFGSSSPSPLTESQTQQMLSQHSSLFLVTPLSTTESFMVNKVKQSSFNLLKLPASSSPFDPNVSKGSAWFGDRSPTHNEPIPWIRAEKRGPLSLPDVISPAIVPSLSLSKALSHALSPRLQAPMAGALASVLHGMLSTGLARRRRPTSGRAVNSHFIQSARRIQGKEEWTWSQDSRRIRSVLTDPDARKEDRKSKAQTGSQRVLWHNFLSVEDPHWCL